MSALTTVAPAGSAQGNAVGGAMPSLGANKSRNPLILILAVVLIIGSAAAFGALYITAGQRTEVIVAAQDIAPGHAITAEDLATARVSAEGVSMISVANAQELIGKRSTVAVGANSLLNPNFLVDELDIAPGRVAMAMPVPGSRHASLLAAGRYASVYGMSAGAQGGTAVLISGKARILDVSESDTGEATVTVELTPKEANQLAGSHDQAIAAVLPLASE